MINNNDICKLLCIFIIRIVNFRRRWRIVTKTAIVAAVQARVTVLMLDSTCPLVDRNWFSRYRWQCLGRWWEKCDRGWYVSSILTRYHWSRNRRRWRTVRVHPVTIRSAIRSGSCLYTQNIVI